MTLLSAFYFPTTTVFIDDDLLFLEQLTATMDGAHQRICQDFDEIAEELRKVPNVCSVADISTVALSQRKHEFISTIVIDYQMKPKNGLELCEQIRDCPAAKIMLTGAASKDKAIEAHNAELIDYFVSKQDPNFIEKLNEAIFAGMRKYFVRLSKRIKGFYDVDNPISNPMCASYLERELENAISYHTWKDFNRVSAVSQSDTQLDFMICSEEDYVALLDSEEANDAPEDVLKRLKERSSLLWHEQTIPPGNEWGSYINGCTKIGDSNFYISKGKFWKLPRESALSIARV
jgi:DNA-binding NarL/FixJ family response regulator